MRHPRPIPWSLSLVLAAMLALGADEPPARPRADATSPATGEEPAAERLSIAKPIACRSISGFEDYEILPEVALTADEKLLIYYRPSGYHVENSGGAYRVHLTQDGQIRRCGEKAVLLRKDKLLEYKFAIANRPNPIYLRNTVSLKGLKPGEYEFEIILHDKIGQAQSATQILPFKVVAAALPRPAGDAETPEESPPAAKPKSKTRPRRPARS